LSVGDSGATLVPEGIDSVLLSTVCNRRQVRTSGYPKRSKLQPRAR